MRGSIWSVVALGAGIVMLPLIMPSSGGGDQVGNSIFGLVSSVAPIVALTFTIAAFGLLLAVLSFDNGF